MKRLHLSMLLLLTLCSAGCSSTSKSLGGGYELKTTRYFSWEPPGFVQSLYFRGGDGLKHRVGKHFMGPILVEGQTAVFVGTIKAREDQLIAVTGGGPCVEVGRGILAAEADRQGVDVAAFVEEHQIHTSYLKRLSNGFELQYSRWRGVNQPHEHVAVSWDELASIMHRVVNSAWSTPTSPRTRSVSSAS